MLYALPFLFFGIAFLYSMAGFGGGSAYIAILAVSGLPIAGLPILALSCNLIVSGQGSWILARSGHLNPRLIIPLLTGSVPAAFIAGAWRIHADAYLWILTGALTLAGIGLLFPPSKKENTATRRSRPTLFILGAFLGALAGLSGIGGGIFLAPVLHLIKAERSREIAGAAALFIALNSAAGLLGQLTKDIDRLAGIPGLLFVLCPLAVLFGGMIGSRLLAFRLEPLRIRRITAIVVLIAAARLWVRLLGGL